MKNSNITIYSKPGCVQCTATARYLDQRKRPYTKIDVSEDAAAFDYVTKELGYMQVPVVETSEGEHWYGFVPDRLAVYI